MQQYLILKLASQLPYIKWICFLQQPPFAVMKCSLLVLTFIWAVFLVKLYRLVTARVRSIRKAAFRGHDDEGICTSHSPRGQEVLPRLRLVRGS